MLERTNSETMLAFVGVRFMIICNFGREVHSSVWQIPKNCFSHLHMKFTFECTEHAYQRRTTLPLKQSNLYIHKT